MAGRIEEAVRLSDAGQVIADGDHGHMPCGLEAWICNVYIATGQPERLVDWCRAQLAHGRDNQFTRTSISLGLTMGGRADEAMAGANDLIDAAEATHNPLLLSYALFASGLAFRDADPNRARVDLRRSLAVAHDSGNRANEAHIASTLCRLEAAHGDRLASFDYFTEAIRHYDDSGNPTIRVPLAALAAFLERLGRHESAATIGGFALAFTAMATQAAPEITTAITHLRGVLGDEIYESLARKGETMTTAAMAMYAYDQIDQARTELNAVSK
jgi:hypothetical protein